MRRWYMVLVVLTLCLASAACSSSDGGGSDCVDLSGDGAAFTVTITDFAFRPSCFTASAAQGISLVNQGGTIHTFTLVGTQVDIEVEGGATVDRGPVAGVVEPGTYDLTCRFHHEMSGEVTIVA